MIALPEPANTSISMRQFALLIPIFIQACNSQDILHQTPNSENTLLVQPAQQYDHAAQLSHSDTPVKRIQSHGKATEHLVIRWPHLEQPNPFSTNPVYYEIWHNEQHVDTVATNSFLLTLDLEYSRAHGAGFGCIRLRAIQGEQRSELSEPICYTVTS